MSNKKTPAGLAAGVEAHNHETILKEKTMVARNYFRTASGHVQLEPLPLQPNSACPFFVEAETDEVKFVCEGRRLDISLKQPGMSTIDAFKAFWLGYETYILPWLIGVAANRIEPTAAMLAFTQHMTEILDIVADAIPPEWRATSQAHRRQMLH